MPQFKGFDPSADQHGPFWADMSEYVPPMPPGGVPERTPAEWKFRAESMRSNLLIRGCHPLLYDYWTAEAAHSEEIICRQAAPT